MERRVAVVDDVTFAAVEALIEDGLCLCTVLTDEAGEPADYRFLRVSRNFEAMTGLRDAAGRTALELVPNLERSWVEAYGRVGLGREPARFSQGSAAMGRAFEVYATPVDPAPRFAILFRDVTTVRRMEEERAHALEAAQHLLKELNHRVMNSFAAISAITAMETRAADAEARPALQRLQGRVQALGALYRRLDGATQVDRIDVADYLGGNVAAFRDAAAADGPDGGSVAIAAEVASLTLPTRAVVPLGLVLNELLTNALRHAPRRIRVGLAHEADQGRLVVEDDGGAADPDAPLGEGIGRGLVQAFVGELGGEVTAASGAAGTRVEVRFPTA